MTLNSSTLKSDLQQILEDKPSLEEAAQRWALAYASYAQNAMSAASSQAVNAMGNMSILQGAFQGAFQSEDPSGSAGAISGGVMGFWAAIVWVGGSGAGSTLVPGNFSLTSELSDIFSDVEEKSESDKAEALAGAFDSGATQVMAMDIPYAQPAPPIIGPIS